MGRGRSRTSKIEGDFRSKENGSINFRAAAKYEMDRINQSSLMSVLSRTFEKTRVLVALALLFSVSAPFVQYACGSTGETTSMLVVEPTGTDAPCGVISDGVHDRLCGTPQSFSGCEGEDCTTDTAEKSAALQSESTPFRVVAALSTGGETSEEAASPSVVTTIRPAPGVDGTVRERNRISVRLRTLSFRL